MKCKNLGCKNNNPLNTEYCDDCIRKELKSFTYDELYEMYAEGKDFIDCIVVVPQDKEALDEINHFKQRWFRLINEELLERS